MDEFKQMQRAIWESGDYATLSVAIEHVGRRLVAAAGVEPGMRVLDVACGAGNAAIPAAQAGATVVGLDLAPSLLEAGRRKAAAAGVEVEFVEGDAEDLPFEDGSFDRVFSTFGHMFAPRHERTAQELMRVTKPGGTIGLCVWKQGGTVDEVFAVSAGYMPPPPPFASPPIAWGSEDYLRERFADRLQDIEVEEHSATIDWDSLEGFADTFMAQFPPMVMAQRMLGERFAQLRDEIVDLWRRLNRSQDGRLDLPQEYLQALIRV